MSNFIDLTGQRFGRLVVVERLRLKPGKVHWLCKCNCGKEAKVLGENLRNQRTLSCGCLRDDLRKVNKLNK